MRLFFTIIFTLCVISGNCQAQSLLSVPGLTDAVATYAKQAKAIGVYGLDNKFSMGGFVPIRTLHDSEQIKYLQLGPGGIIKQNEHAKGGLVITSDVSAVVRKIEGRSAWYQAHVDKVTLPDIWIGFSVLPPFDESFTWGGYKGWMGLSLAIGL